MLARTHATLTAARSPRVDTFDAHVLACLLASALVEIEHGETTITEATGLDVATLVHLLGTWFPGARRAPFRFDAASAPVVEMEEELLRDLLAAHAVTVGASDDGRPAAVLSFQIEGNVALRAEGAKTGATSSSPPLWGRDREGGRDFSSFDAVESGSAVTPLPGPPPQGGRGYVRRGHVESRASMPLPIRDVLPAMIARRAMRPDHLWQDLGLRDRGELNRLLARHFPALHAGNTANMRWKKYFYRKLCEAEGFALCTAPSCAVCADFTSCFGAEDGESRLAVTRRAVETGAGLAAVAP